MPATHSDVLFSRAEIGVMPCPSCSKPMRLSCINPRWVEPTTSQKSKAPGGMGESGTSAIMPAIANAIFAATGKRLRKLRLTWRG